MARLWTCGFEWGDKFADGLNTGTSFTYQTTDPRSGARCADLAAISNAWKRDFAGVVTTAYYARSFNYIVALPNSADQQMLAFSGAAWALAIVVTTGGITRCMDTVGAVQIGSDGPTIAADDKTWHNFSLVVAINAAAGANDTVVATVDGAILAFTGGATLGTTGPTSILSQWIGANSSGRFKVDDIALNDNNAGGSETGIPPGNAKTDVAFPISNDVIGTNWLNGDGSATASFDGINNVPPTGKAVASQGASDAIGDFAGTNTDQATFNCETYGTLGIGGSDTLGLVQQILCTGSNSATDTAGQHQITSNPAEGAATSFTTFDNGIQGTHPTNWRLVEGPVNYAPTVTIGSSPILMVKKNTATTRDTCVDAMGLIVEWVPDQPQLAQARTMRAGG